MSDSSSSPPRQATDSTRSSPPSTQLSFLVHSPETVQGSFSADADNRPLARQKRRRTSKEDEEILKAEYRRNPKPDKAARMDIVSRVALGEKEVQIWFQNKRQNDRRRSRAPQSFDIIPHTSPSQGSLAEADASSFGPLMEADRQPLIIAASTLVEGIEEAAQSALVAVSSSDASSVAAPLCGSAASSETAHCSATPPTSSVTKLDSQSSVSVMQTSDTCPTDLSASQPIMSSQESVRSFESQSGYLANRRSASFIKMDEADLAGPSIRFPAPIEPQAESRSLRRTHSYVRLSMTADGKARVITDADQSPSPPRANVGSGKSASRNLRRSFSAAGFNERLAQAGALSEPPTKIKRTSTAGRSRDSRAWEFWCDSDARNSLMEKADQERSGSAADAIGLIRAHSRGALTTNAAKRNVQLRKASPGPRTKASRSGLMRALTSQGRLQTKSQVVGKENQGPMSLKDGGKSADGEKELEMVINTDSDKENLEPMEGRNRRRRLPGSVTSKGTRQILGENAQVMSLTNNLNAALERGKRTKVHGSTRSRDDTENTNPEDDEELAAFMGSRTSSGRPSSVTVSSGEELGCVEGLLKLSQGAWK